MTRHNDVVNKTWEWRDAANEKGSNGAPVGAKLGRIAVDSVEVVHVGHGYITTSDNEVAIGQVKSVGGLKKRYGTHRSTYSHMRMPVMGPKKIV